MVAIRAGVYRAAVLRDALGGARYAEWVGDGTAVRLRRGWYAVGEAPSDVVAAVRRGGVLSCVSALDRAGVWVPEHHDLHVRGNRWATANLPGPFCRRFGRPEPECDAVDDVPTALRHAVRCLDDEGLVVACDSVLNRGLLSLEQIERLLAAAPRRVLRLLDRCDGRAESGPESMVRLRLRSRTVRVRPQVVIDGVGRVDLLVGRWLIIEIDGFEFHGDRSGFERYRLRDVRAHELGYTPLRFTYRQVVYDWPETECAIMNAIHAGAHHRPARRV